MHKLIRSSLILVLIASAGAVAEETVLFNGKDLEGWSFHREGEPVKKMEETWVVQDGLMIFTGATTSYLMHKNEFENYVLTLEWRSMKTNRNGVAVSCSGEVFIHASDEEGVFKRPKSVEISLHEVGDVFLRDIKQEEIFKSDKWVFSAPDFADDVEKDLGEWNHLKLICRGKRLTVIANGTPVNQVNELNRSKGAIALRATRGFIASPLFFRNIKVQSLTKEHEQEETAAAGKLAKLKQIAAQKEAARKANREEEKRQEKLKAEAFERMWAKIDVRPEIEFKPDALALPFPADASGLRFRAVFGHIELSSKSAMQTLSKFYRTEMARRGWQEVEKERDEDSVEVTFQQEKAKVELDLDQDSDGVDIRLVCRGLTFDGTNDPAGLVAKGLPQPKAYLFLQKEVPLPDNVQGLQYDSGNRCLFKSSLSLQEAFDHFGKQLRAKGYRETRRPILSSNRRYTEFGKGRVEISVNVFSDKVGSRIILTYEGR